ncbi:divalent metal cation (Fe/Co/Zn/Cd) transporter [Nocardiopsis aegyptia]|uniref:Divalent metal cation (Fe/Co/Zn/Cd) transporter n=2 Tax=Nocardiopsis aegyptia TaxID=220378 RepID=A0A7Z0EJH2_9ACTN|nr:divalent metal cation (Fe/Co/Zn/Cd) transporter [Nocardiopsis aegyptia]
MLMVLSAERSAVLTRRIRLLVAATIVYNLGEAVVAIWAGRVASSAALVGFGLDSLVEVSSALAVAWQFSARDARTRQAREAKAMRVIALAFFALAAYVTVEALRSLLGAQEADPSVVGIVLAALSVVIMPALSLSQRRAGRELGSASAVADSKQTLLCAYLSVALLGGLLLNALWGWAWADPVVALLIAVMAVREGVEAWRGDACCGSAASALVGGELTGEDGCCSDCSDGGSGCHSGPDRS